jgi:HEAT repeat protein
VAKGGDQTLKHSIDRSSRELVYLPVSRAIKVQAKSAIDMVVDRCGDGLAGLVQLAVITALVAWGLNQFSMVRMMGIVNLVFLALWLLIAVRLRRSYVDELSRSIAEGRVEVGSWHEAMAGADTLAAVERALDSEDPDNAMAALDLVAANPQWDMTESLCRLARDGSPEVRARALAILLDPANPDLPEGVAVAFEREDQNLLAECVDLQLAVDPEERKQRAQAILARAGGPARGAWIALMVRRLGPEFGPVARGLLEQLLDKSSPADAREVAATAIGMLPAESGMADLLPRLLQDDDHKVASAAARSAGAVGGEAHLARVVPLLGSTPTRRAARVALQSRGDDSIPVLLAAVADTDLDPLAKSKIPHVLSGIDSPEAMAGLARLLSGDDPLMVTASSQALYRVRMKKPDGAMIPAMEAKELILAQAARCSRLIEQIQTLEQDSLDQRTAAWPLMLDSLRSAYARHHLAVFQTLCLCYSPRHIVNCRRSLVDRNLELRANAAELLDNLVPRKLWRELLPVLYREEFGDMSARPPGGPQESDTVLEQLTAAEDTWLAEVAAQLRHERGAGPAPAEGDPMGAMTVVEKVVALQGVEVFKETPPEQLALIGSIAEEVQLPTGTELALQDDPPGDLYVVLEGKLSIFRDGKQLGTLGPGEALGTWALFEDEPQQVSATVAEETRALKIDRWGFDEAIDEHPEIARSLIRQLIRRLRTLAG